jgi:uncharacterized protein RhaS with RHS repeats
MNSIKTALLIALFPGLLLSPGRVSACYDPGTQRWINRDQVEEAGGVNLYGYVGNDPISYIDPIGLSWYVDPPASGGSCGPPKANFVNDGQDWIVQIPAQTDGGITDLSRDFWDALNFVRNIPRDLLGLVKPTVFSMARDKIKKGVIYRVDGKDTPSKKPYVGRTTNPQGPPGRGKADGRDRSNAKVVEHYDVTQEGRIKEQRAIDANGGLSKLDNKRNEIAPGNCPGP